MLGKVLGAEVSGTGSIAAGAAALDAFTAANGAPGFEHHDASGLSYADRVTARAWCACCGPPTSSRGRPTSGSRCRPAGRARWRAGWATSRVRAKTGTLTDISALSGWVWSRKVKDWVEFSILSDGLSKDEAVRIEDAIVALVSARATAPVT